MIELYRQGLSFRGIGRKAGWSERYVRERVIKLQGNQDIVSSVLLARITQARTRRQRKHSIAMLRRHRPELYARWLLERMPELVEIRRLGNEWCGKCPNCLTLNAYVRGKRDSWAWRCYSCEASGTCANMA